jgi:hypothetical protein
VAFIALCESHAAFFIDSFDPAVPVLMIILAGIARRIIHSKHRGSRQRPSKLPLNTGLPSRLSAVMTFASFSVHASLSAMRRALRGQR